MENQIVLNGNDFTVVRTTTWLRSPGPGEISTVLQAQIQAGPDGDTQKQLQEIYGNVARKVPNEPSSDFTLETRDPESLWYDS
jgi:hypothetical protein